MKFVLEFGMDNDAFMVHPEGEIKRILNLVAAQVIEGTTGFPIFDYNGNRIGHYEIKTGGS